MEDDDDKYESAVETIEDLIAESGITAFGKIVAISAILNSLNPMSEEDMKRGMEVARKLRLS